ncbi:MAG TPA: sugar phosphate nucleotidyltransferase, partial [Candidatus Saccharimonadales bacterium]
LVGAGIKDIIIVGSSNKRSIEDHFDVPNEDLLSNLRAGGPKKQHYIDELNELSNLANFIYIRQKGPYGNATPLMSAAHLIGKNESFIYTWADDFIVASPSRFQQMIDLHMKYDGAVLSCKKVQSDKEYDKYGIAAGETVEDGLIKMSHIVEKPGKENAPSDLASVSSYLLTGEFFAYLEEAQKTFDGNGEFTFQPIMQKMIDEGYNYYAYQIKDSRYYDTGDKLEYLKTVIDFGLMHEELGADLEAFIRSRIS